MDLFILVIIMLTAVLFSNILNRFMPAVSVPVIQVVLGALIGFLPLGGALVFEPDLFFILFVAPLVYHAAATADKKSLWAMKGQILNMSVLLVIAGSVAVGLLVSWLVPAIPIAVAITLVAALGPTDDVAVACLSKRFSLPSHMKALLQGESAFNDVSALILFQIGLAVVVSGSFSLGGSIVEFLLVGVGGVLAGLFLSIVKALLASWLRSRGIANDTVHVLVEILAPFLIYYLAEQLHVSGILAIFTAGIMYSFEKGRLNPDTATTSATANSVWSVLSFSLEGVVFIMLGTQLPAILHPLIGSTYSISTAHILLSVLMITLVLALLRFIWAIITLPENAYEEGAAPIGRLKASVIFSLSGARGAVTLASIFSIPLLLSDGSAFPERDLMVILSMGLILCSILLTYFLLPLFISKKEEDAQAVETEAQTRILQQVAEQLARLALPEERQRLTLSSKTISIAAWPLCAEKMRRLSPTTRIVS